MKAVWTIGLVWRASTQMAREIDDKKALCACKLRGGIISKGESVLRRVFKGNTAWAEILGSRSKTQLGGGIRNQRRVETGISASKPGPCSPFFCRRVFIDGLDL
jgi:hypothetical protein